MNTGGFSTERLTRMRATLEGHVGSGRMPGLVSVISRGGETYVEAIGRQSFGSAEPMRRDSIFRISSMTKPVIGAATMLLLERCQLRLDQSVDDLLPELANRRVLRRIDADLDDTVPANRSITVRDLLTFRFGFGSVMAAPDTYPIQKAVRELQLGSDGPPIPSRTPAPDEWMRRLGSLPLMYQPGTKWAYDTGADVLGVLISRVSGQSLETFLQENFFGPLSMNDTAFSVPASKTSRLPGCYTSDPATGKIIEYDAEGNRSDWSKPPSFQSGAGGLVGTADDYLNFCLMLLNGGKRGHVRVLSRPSIELMMSDHLTTAQREDAELFFKGHSSWGFCGAVDIKRSELYTVPGRFGWTGGLGTSAYTDPREQMVGIILTQRLMDSPEPPQVFSDFFTSAYQALDD